MKRQYGLQLFAALLTFAFLLLRAPCLFAQVPQELLGLWEWKYKKDRIDRIDHFTYQFIAPDSFVRIDYAQGGDVAFVGKVKANGDTYLMEHDSLLYIRDIGATEWERVNDPVMLKLKWEFKLHMKGADKLLLVWLPTENRARAIRFTLRKVEQPSPTWPRKPLSEEE